MNHARSIALYRRVSSLYPKAFRAEYGDDLVATFAEQLRDGAAGRVWLSTVRDLVVTVPTQHLEARMKRPNPRTVAMIATATTLAALILAVVAGTGPVVGVFLLAAVIALSVATLSWRAARSADHSATAGQSRWRTLLIGGIALVAVVIVVINVPPYNDRELPEAGWALMMLSLLTGVALITVGATLGLSRRANSHATTH